jgi:hypothetical protein
MSRDVFGGIPDFNYFGYILEVEYITQLLRNFILFPIATA